MRNNKQTGFTLVELLIATTVFSIILLAAATALIQVTRMYYKGIISSRTQAAAREVTDEISRTLQFTSGKIVATNTGDGQSPSHYVLCVGNTRYTFTLREQLNDSLADGAYDASKRQVRHVLWRDKDAGGACARDVDLKKISPTAGGREILDSRMRLKSLRLDPIGTKGDAFTLTVGVIYGETDLLDDPNDPKQCKVNIVGTQWCAFSELKTEIYRRVE